MTLPIADHVLDTTGLICPEPLMLLHKAMRKASSGQTIHMISTDPSSVRDVTKFCLHLGHTLVHTHCTEASFEYWLSKK